MSANRKSENDSKSISRRIDNLRRLVRRRKVASKKGSALDPIISRKLERLDDG